ncbi:DUF5130 family protein [Microlunatus sp. Gsoil 973]|uniref:DUF5130 family protein n=1 Tax=Microlunatus sp. Gsoil 973 TaxID=2672569 RepID=UPI001E5E2CEB|nr:DUF5130 family protein [Microlunatus sp. Gsoil 973]
MSAGDLVPAAAGDPLADPFRPVHGTGPLTPFEIGRVERVIRYAREVAGLPFAVFIGPAEPDSRAYALRLHGALPDPDRSVLVVVDPAARVLEIVTGGIAARSLGDPECRLAAATMQSSFVVHDLAGGLTAGIQQLANAAYHAPTLHLSDTHEPY